MRRKGTSFWCKNCSCLKDWEVFALVHNIQYVSFYRPASLFRISPRCPKTYILCLLQTCTFRVDYTLENIPGREFGSVFVGASSENVAVKVVSEGWAKVMSQTSKFDQSLHDMSPFSDNQYHISRGSRKNVLILKRRWQGKDIK